MIPQRDLELLERYIDGTLADGEAEELRSLLRESTDARAMLRSMATVDFGLQDLAASAAEMGSSEESGRLQARDPKGPSALIRRAGWPLAVAASTVIALGVGLTLARPRDEPEIARVAGLGGVVLWTGDGGLVTGGLRVGEELTGGTIEGTTPGSWAMLEFTDGSTVTISGNSMLTFSDHGRKELHLKKGSVSGDVNPQAPGRPMLVHTRSALLEVVGTRFEVESDLASTALNVDEGEVRVRRLSDGGTVAVPAGHRLVADPERALIPEAIPGAVHRWTSRLQLGPDSTMGKWSSGSEGREAGLRAIPYVHVTPQGDAMTVCSAALQVSGGDEPPVVLQPGSQIRVRGRLARPRDVVLGVTVRHPDGGFGGNFLTDRPASSFGGGGGFELALDIDELRLDPAFVPMKDKLAGAPVGVVVESFWCASLEPAGLEIVAVEMSSSVSAGP